MGQNKWCCTEGCWEYHGLIEWLSKLWRSVQEHADSCWRWLDRDRWDSLNMLWGRSSWRTCVEQVVLGKFSPEQFPPDNSPPDNPSPRVFPTQKITWPDISSRTIPTRTFPSRSIPSLKNKTFKTSKLWKCFLQWPSAAI